LLLVGRYSLACFFCATTGWQLGELNEWSKKTNTELATHIPLIIRVPWKTAAVGVRTTVKIELVDMYKTLADLAGLDMSTVQPSVQGLSLAPVFDAPTSPPQPFAEKRAFSQIGRCNCGMYKTRQGPTPECGGNACCLIPITCPPGADPETCDKDTNSSHWDMSATGTYDYMGYTMRTNDARLTIWLQMDDDTARPIWPAGGLDDMGDRIELYDLHGDDGRDFDYDGYSLNVANMPQNKEKVAALWAELKVEVPKWL
jgi:hypothetical protein